MFSLPKLNQKGAIPLLLLVAAIGVIGFLAFSSLAPFKAKKEAQLYPKEESKAAETSLVVYFDTLTTGWRDWSSGSVDVNLADTLPASPALLTSSGTKTASFIITKKFISGDDQFYLHTGTTANGLAYDRLHFAVLGTKAGQKYALQMVDANDNAITALKPLAGLTGCTDPTTTAWTVCDIPFSVLNPGRVTFKGFQIVEYQNTNVLPLGKVYIDDIKFISGATSSSTPTATTTPTSSVTPTVTPSAMPSSTPTPTPTSGIWKPAANAPIHWQWQIGTSPFTAGNLLPNVNVYVIDGFDNTASVVSLIHAQGTGYKAVCYFSAGSWENWRSDASQFPTAIKGKALSGWAGEKWLDIRGINDLNNVNAQKLRQVMQARMDMCKQKGFDAVEPDNIDGYANNTGFVITAQDQINYNKFLADQVHARGMSIGLKNDGDQVTSLLPYFDWALNEECNRYNECGYLSQFISTGKAAFNVEYQGQTSTFCPKANTAHYNSMLRNLDLTAAGTRVPCTADTKNSW